MKQGNLMNGYRRGVRVMDNLAIRKMLIEQGLNDLVLSGDRKPYIYVSDIIEKAQRDTAKIEYKRGYDDGLRQRKA